MSSAGSHRTLATRPEKVVGPRGGWFLIVAEAHVSLQRCTPKFLPRRRWYSKPLHLGRLRASRAVRSWCPFPFFFFLWARTSVPRCLEMSRCWCEVGDERWASFWARGSRDAAGCGECKPPACAGRRHASERGENAWRVLRCLPPHVAHDPRLDALHSGGVARWERRSPRWDGGALPDVFDHRHHLAVCLYDYHEHSLGDGWGLRARLSVSGAGGGWGDRHSAVPRALDERGPVYLRFCGGVGVHFSDAPAVGRDSRRLSPRFFSVDFGCAPCFSAALAGDGFTNCCDRQHVGGLLHD